MSVHAKSAMCAIYAIYAMCAIYAIYAMCAMYAKSAICAIAMCGVCAGAHSATLKKGVTVTPFE